MIRLGMTLGIKEEKIEEYKKLHANVWPEVLENLTELNFKNYFFFSSSFSELLTSEKKIRQNLAKM